MTATTSRPTTEYEELGLSNMARVLPYLSEFDLARWIGTTEGMARILETRYLPSGSPNTHQNAATSKRLGSEEPPAYKK